MKVNTTAAVDASSTLRETVAAHPATKAVFTEYGMDSCCGGDLKIADAARAHGVELAVLLEKLAKATEG